MASTVQNSFSTIEKQCNILKSFGIPCIFSSNQEDRIFFFGTPNATDIFKQKTLEIKKAFGKDIEDMKNAEKDIYLKLQAPLSLSNANEVKKYARYLIVEDFKKRNSNMKISRIKYGDPVWEPTSWPNNDLSWTSVKNFSELRKSEISGNLSINDVLKTFIENTLKLTGVDPELFYDKNVFDVKTEKARKKNRCIKMTDEDTGNISNDSQANSACNAQEVHSDNSEKEPNSASNTEEPHSASHNPEELCSSNDQEALIAHNGQDTNGAKNDQEPLLASNLQEPNCTSNDQEVLSASNDQETLYASNDQEAPSSSNCRGALSGRNMQEPGSVGNDQEALGASNDEVALGACIGQEPFSAQNDEEPLKARNGQNPCAASDAQEQRSTSNAQELCASLASEKSSLQESIISFTTVCESNKDSSIKTDSSETSQSLTNLMERNGTLDKLLEIPPQSVQRAEREQQEKLDAFQARRAEEADAHKQDMDRMDEGEKLRIEKQKEKELEIIEIQIQSDHLRQNLTETQIKKIFHANRKFFKNVSLGLQPAWRHRLYMSSQNKSRNITFLRTKMIGQPFSDSQQDMIYEEVKKVWLNTRDLQLKNNEYVELVLLPEVFITIYQKFFHLPSAEMAEERIFNIGSMDPDDVSPKKSVFIK